MTLHCVAALLTIIQGGDKGQERKLPGPYARRKIFCSFIAASLFAHKASMSGKPSTVGLPGHTSQKVSESAESSSSDSRLASGSLSAAASAADPSRDALPAAAGQLHIETRTS